MSFLSFLFLHRPKELVWTALSCQLKTRRTSQTWPSTSQKGWRCTLSNTTRRFTRSSSRDSEEHHSWPAVIFLKLISCTMPEDCAGTSMPNKVLSTNTCWHGLLSLSGSRCPLTEQTASCTLTKSRFQIFTWGHWDHDIAATQPLIQHVTVNLIFGGGGWKHFTGMSVSAFHLMIAFVLFNTT